MASESNSCRDTLGRFSQGNAGGPGRPRRQVEDEYQYSMYEVVSVDQWRKITAKAVEDALKGDAKARDWLSKHLLGDPLSSGHVDSNRTEQSEIDYSKLTDDELEEAERLNTRLLEITAKASVVR